MKVILGFKVFILRQQTKGFENLSAVCQVFVTASRVPLKQLNAN